MVVQLEPVATGSGSCIGQLLISFARLSVPKGLAGVFSLTSAQSVPDRGRIRGAPAQLRRFLSNCIERMVVGQFEFSAAFASRS